MKIYIDRQLAIKSTLKTVGLAVAGLIILIVLNYFTDLLAGLTVAPFILAAPALFAIITIYRNLWLIMLPEFILNENEVKCFNVLWYNTHSWNSFDIITYSKSNEIVELKLDTGKILEKINLDNLAPEKREAFLSQMEIRKAVDYV